MKEYKVLHVNLDGYANVESSEYTWPLSDGPYYLAAIKAQESALNYYAQQGWRLVQTGHAQRDHSFLYLERDISESN